MPRWWTPQPLPSLRRLPALQTAAELLLRRQERRKLRWQRQRQRRRRREQGYQTLATSSTVAAVREYGSGDGSGGGGGGSGTCGGQQFKSCGGWDSESDPSSDRGSDSRLDLDLHFDLDLDLDLEADLTERQDLDLHRPSVGHRKTVNAVRHDGVHVSVMAQHYAVLVTDVQQPVYGPFDDDDGVGGGGAASGGGGVAATDGSPEQRRACTPGRLAAWATELRSLLGLGRPRRWPRWFHWPGGAPLESAAEAGSSSGGGGGGGGGSLGSRIQSTPPSKIRSASATPAFGGGSFLGALGTAADDQHRTLTRCSGTTARVSAAASPHAAGTSEDGVVGGGAAAIGVRGHRRSASAAASFAGGGTPGGGGAAAAARTGGGGDGVVSPTGMRLRPEATLIQPERVRRALLLAALAAAEQRAAVERACADAGAATPARTPSGGGSGWPPCSGQRRRHQRCFSEHAGLLHAVLSGEPLTLTAADGGAVAAAADDGCRTLVSAPNAEGCGRHPSDRGGNRLHFPLPDGEAAAAAAAPGPMAAVSAAATPVTAAGDARGRDDGRRDAVSCLSPAVLPMSPPPPPLPPPQQRASVCSSHPPPPPSAAENHVTTAAGGGGDDSNSSTSGSASASGSGSRCPGASAAAAARWAFVRAAVASGAVAALPRSRRYCVVSATFSRLFPEDFDRAVPVVNHREVDQLLRRLDGHVAEYERVGQRLRRRTWWPGRLQRRQQMLSPLLRLLRQGDAGSIGSGSVADEAADSDLDLIRHHRNRISELRDQVEAARRRALACLQGTGSFLVFFRTQLGAAMAAQCAIHPEREDPRVGGPDSDYFKVRPAPGPDEVNWPALWLRSAQRSRRTALVTPLLAALLLLVPVGLFSGGLQQLNHLLCPPPSPSPPEAGVAAAAGAAAVWPWYCSQRSLAARVLQRLVVAWLPTLLLSLWQGMVLPVTNWLLIQASGTAFSLSAVDQQLAANLFLYDTFNAFLGGVVGSALIQGLRTALSSGPSALMALLGSALPASSNFFLSYLAFRALVAAPLRLLIPHVGLRLYLLRRYCRPAAAAVLSCSCCSRGGAKPGERERALMTAPVSPRYGYEVGMLLLVFLIGASFAVVAPLLLPAALAVFAAAWLFWRYALLYVYVRQYESGGTMWPEVVFGRLVAVVAVAAAFSAAALLARGGTAQGVLLLAGLPPLLLRFHRRCVRRYRGGEAAMPLTLAVDAPTASVDPWVFMPPPLHHQALGWHPDWNVPWRGWGLPPYSI
ncbi:hypothetical protein PLESTB_000995000 [Pleodorina starrii]|uniref:CSC1/OSCA1-like 7TM region domain-containing protein n=1 Tax=Pleodorina starrii TaxID=330485 RepID=A0A9W6BPP3_9CHLO|nr:hypothetical protein PLESTB_000995000 [Pleodorina starrii]